MLGTALSQRRRACDGAVSVAAKKGTILAAKWCPTRGPFGVSLSLLSRKGCSERPGAVKGAPLLCAAQRTLDGEDRSEMIAEEGKAGRKVGETWAAQMVPSPTASNSQKEGFGFGGGLNPRARPRGLARPVTLYESGWLASRPNATLPLSKALTELPIRSQLIDEMEVNRPNVSLGRCQIGRAHV